MKSRSTVADRPSPSVSSTARVAAAWTARGSVSCELGLRMTYSLWRQARKDTSAGIPRLTDGLAPSATPRVHELDRLRMEIIERERLHLIGDTAPAVVRFSEVDELIRQASAQLAEAEAELAAVAAEPGEEVLSRRRGGEDRVAAATVRERRQREHDRLREPLRAKVTDRRAAVHRLRAEQAVLSEQIQRRALAAQRRAGLFDEFLRRCCARYAGTLIRRHPHGAALARLGWPSLGGLPPWVSDPDLLALVIPAVRTSEAEGAR